MAKASAGAALPDPSESWRMGVIYRHDNVTMNDIYFFLLT